MQFPCGNGIEYAVTVGCIKRKLDNIQTKRSPGTKWVSALCENMRYLSFVFHRNDVIQVAIYCEEYSSKNM